MRQWTSLFLLGLLFSLPLAAGQTRDPQTHFFQETFGDFQEELQTARDEGKDGILIVFELDECPFCHRMKQTVLNRPEIQDWYRKHFRIFSVDIEGDTEIVDFKGRSMKVPLHRGHLGARGIPVDGRICGGQALRENAFCPLQAHEAQGGTATPMKRLAGTLLAALILLLSQALGAPLPQPLTLAQALALADAHHPLLERSRAELEAARAQLLQADSSDDLQLRAELDARWVKPPTFAPQTHDDSRARLSLDKRLYDFGRTENSIAAARLDAEGRRVLLELERRRLRLQVMKRFFEVLLADLEFARDNEEMAVVYVRLDKARKKNELGQLSDIDLMALEARYQKVRSKRYRSEARQRLARQRLALLLGRPEDLPDTLEHPVLNNDRSLPEYEELVRKALADNPQLQALRTRLEGAARQLEAARASDRPVITGRMEATHYQRSFGARDPFRASLAIDIPLYTGGRRQAEEADAWARLHALQAELREAELDLREQLLDNWQQIQTLKAQRDLAATEQDYRDLYLDRSRTRYEQELTTDLGDAMVRQSEARLLASRTEFQLALAWATLDLLTGNPPEAALKAADDNTRINPPNTGGDTP